MTIRFEIPQDIEQQARINGADLNGEAREAYLIDLYRQDRITHHQLTEALGLNRYETDGVLKRHEVSPGVTAEEMRTQAAASSRYGTIESTPGICGGSARISGTRIPVWVLVEAHRDLGVSESQLLLDYPKLRAVNLVDAWDYVRDHRDEIAAEIRRNAEVA